MFKQRAISQGQVQRLVGGTLVAYELMQQLSAQPKEKAVEGGLFSGKSVVTVDTDLTLGKIVDNMIQVRAETTIPGQAVSVKSGEYNEAVHPDQVDLFEAIYSNEMDALQREMSDLIAQERLQNSERVGYFKEAMAELQEAYKAGDMMATIGAVEKVTNIAEWGTRVPVTHLYQGAEAMKELAEFNEEVTGSEEAKEIAGRLDITLNYAKVGRILPLWDMSEEVGALDSERLKRVLALVETGSLPILRRVRPVQVYEGPLDPHVIAQDMVRMYG